MSAIMQEITQKDHKEKEGSVTNSSSIATTSASSSPTAASTISENASDQTSKKASEKPTEETFEDKLKKYFKEYGISSLPDDLNDNREKENQETQENHLSKGNSVHSPSDGQFDIYVYYLESLTAEALLEETMLYVLASGGNIHHRRVCMFWQSPEGLCAFIFTFQGINHTINQETLYNEILANQKDPEKLLQNEQIVNACKNLYKKIEVFFLRGNQKIPDPTMQLATSVRGAYANMKANIINDPHLPTFNIGPNSIRDKFNRYIISFLKWGEMNYEVLFHQAFRKLVNEFELMSASENKSLNKSASIQHNFLLKVCEYRSLNQEIRNLRNKNKVTSSHLPAITFKPSLQPTSDLPDTKHLQESNHIQSATLTLDTTTQSNDFIPVKADRIKPSKRKNKNLKKKIKKQSFISQENASGEASAIKANSSINSRSINDLVPNNASVLGLLEDGKEPLEIQKIQRHDNPQPKKHLVDFEFIHAFLISQKTFIEGSKWTYNVYENETKNLWKYFQEQVQDWKNEENKTFKEVLALSNHLIDRLKLIANREAEIPWIVPQILFEALTEKNNPKTLKEILGLKAHQAIMSSEYTNKIISDFHSLFNNPSITVESNLSEEILDITVSLIKHQILKNYTKILDVIVSKNPDSKLTILQNTLKAYHLYKTKVTELKHSDVLKNTGILPLDTILKFMHLMKDRDIARVNSELALSSDTLLEDLTRRLQKNINKNIAWEERQKETIAELKSLQPWHQKTLNFFSEHSLPGMVGSLVQRALQPVVHYLANNETLISLKEIIKGKTECYEGLDEDFDYFTEGNILALLNLSGAALSLYATGPFSLFHLEFLASNLITRSLTANYGMPNVDPSLSAITYPTSLHGFSESNYFRCTQVTIAAFRSVYSWSPDPLFSLVGGTLSSKIIINLIEKILGRFLLDIALEEQSEKTGKNLSRIEKNEETQVNREQEVAQRKEKRTTALQALSQLIYHMGYSQFSHQLRNVRQEYQLLIARILKTYEKSSDKFENQENSETLMPLLPETMKHCARLTIIAPSTSSRILSALNPVSPLLFNSNAFVRVGCLRTIATPTSSASATLSDAPLPGSTAIYTYDEHYCQLTHEAGLIKCIPNNPSPGISEFNLIEASATHEYQHIHHGVYRKRF